MVHMIVIQDLRHGPASLPLFLPCSATQGRVCSSRNLFRTHFHLASMSENITWDKAWSTGSRDSGKEEGGKRNAGWEGSWTKRYTAGATMTPRIFAQCTLKAAVGRMVLL